MSYTVVQLVNGGLSKLGQSRVRQLSPPLTPLEHFIAENYPQWREEEIAKRRWVFAWQIQYALTLVATLTTGVDKPYKFQMPADCARPIRGKYDEWQQSGRFIYSAYSTLKIDYVRVVTEADFDPLFNAVMRCKVAVESAEFVTQSNAKRQTKQMEYDEAIAEAKKANGFTVGPEDIQADDSDFSWLNARHNPGYIE